MPVTCCDLTPVQLTQDRHLPATGPGDHSLIIEQLLLEGHGGGTLRIHTDNLSTMCDRNRRQAPRIPRNPADSLAAKPGERKTPSATRPQGRHHLPPKERNRTEGEEYLERKNTPTSGRNADFSVSVRNGRCFNRGGFADIGRMTTPLLCVVHRRRVVREYVAVCFGGDLSGPQKVVPSGGFLVSR